MTLNYNYQKSLSVTKVKNTGSYLNTRHDTIIILYGGETKIISYRKSMSVANFLNLKENENKHT